jgi:hypothetical protein
LFDEKYGQRKNKNCCERTLHHSPMFQSRPTPSASAARLI